MHEINIRQAKYQDEYKIILSFDNGKKGIVDLKNFIFNKDCGIFKVSQNKEKFKNFSLKFHTLVWSDDIDLAPEFLYDLLTKQNKHQF